jgi:hypothetical protein
MYPLLVTTRRCRDGVSMVSFRVEAGSGDSGHIRVLNAKRDLNADDHLRGASHIQHGGGNHGIIRRCHHDVLPGHIGRMRRLHSGICVQRETRRGIELGAFWMRTRRPASFSSASSPYHQTLLGISRNLLLPCLLLTTFASSSMLTWHRLLMCACGCAGCLHVRRRLSLCFPCRSLAHPHHRDCIPRSILRFRADRVAARIHAGLDSRVDQL